MLNECDHLHTIETAHGSFCMNCGHLAIDSEVEKVAHVSEEPIGRAINIEIHHQNHAPKSHHKAKIEKASVKIKVEAA